MTADGRKRKLAAREVEKKRMSAMMGGGGRNRKRVAPPTEQEVARAMEEFRARGGGVREVAPAEAGSSVVVGKP